MGIQEQGHDAYPQLVKRLPVLFKLAAENSRMGKPVEFSVLREAYNGFVSRRCVRPLGSGVITLGSRLVLELLLIIYMMNWRYY